MSCRVASAAWISLIVSTTCSTASAQLWIVTRYKAKLGLSLKEADFLPKQPATLK